MGMDPQDLFSQLFGGGGASFFGGGRPTGPRKGKDLVHRVTVSLEDLYKGKTTKLALTKHVICSKCNGKGGKPGAVKSCGGCNGRGIKVTLRQMGPMLQQIQQACHECDGSGEIINPKDKCKPCNGKKLVSERKFLEVHIDKGMKGGQTITFAGESDQAPDVIPGDVVIVLDEKPHDRFKRQDNNLSVDVEVDLLTALGGGQFAIQHLDDRALIVNLVPGEIVKHGEFPPFFPLALNARAEGRTSIGAVKVILGQGMPSYRHHDFGDLFVNLHVKFPDHVDPNAIALLEQALPPREPLPKFPSSVVTEEVELQEMDARQKHNYSKGDAMDEDEDSQARVQCANQ